MAKDEQVILPSRLGTKAATGTLASRYDKGARIPSDSQNYYSTDIEAIRNFTDPTQAIRVLSRKEGTTGTAVFSFTQIADSGYSLKAFSTSTNEFDPDGTNLAMSVLASIDTLYDYSKGYADKRTVKSLLVAMLKEVTISSFIGLELVLNKQRLPDKLVPVPFNGIVWNSKGDGTKYPVQPGTFTGGDDIELNIPTFWTSVMQEDLTRLYASPMFEPAIDRSIQFLGFVQDMWRTVKVAGHTRLIVKLNAENIKASAPKDVQKSAVKLKKYMEDQLLAVKDLVEGLQPEDAIVVYDTADVENLAAKDIKSDYSSLMATISGMLATSLKAHPSILGLRMEGSQSLSNTESLVFLQNAAAIQVPVEDVMSRAMTLATRLYGADVYVKFKFNDINLRPADELEAYKVMKQSRVNNDLSLGRITDEDAAAILQTGPLPAGAPLLSGTMFMHPQPTSQVDDPNAPRDPQGEVLSPDTPASTGGNP